MLSCVNITYHRPRFTGQGDEKLSEGVTQPPVISTYFAFVKDLIQLKQSKSKVKTQFLKV